MNVNDPYPQNLLLHLGYYIKELLYISFFEDIYLLDQYTVYNYLPSLRTDLSNYLTIPQKADYIRLAILNKYGGIWLDSDIIVFKSLLPLVNKLKEIDYIGFGYHGLMLNNMFAKNGYGKPANWAMISRKNGILVG